jgi:hypothetical protein
LKQQLFIKASFSLDSDHGWYNYIIESNQPLNCITFHTDFSVDVVDPLIIKQTTPSTTAISVTKPSLIGLHAGKPKGILHIHVGDEEEVRNHLRCKMEKAIAP